MTRLTSLIQNFEMKQFIDAWGPDDDTDWHKLERVQNECPLWNEIMGPVETRTKSEMLELACILSFMSRTILDEISDGACIIETKI